MDSATQPGIERMTNHVHTYTSLQCLLLLQALAAHRPESEAFTQAAELLKNSALFKQNLADEDTQSISPDTLRSMFDKILQDASSRRSEMNGEQVNGNVPEPIEKKHEPPGQMAVELIPSLYDDYKRRIIEDIRAEERKYSELMKDYQELKEAKVPEETPNPAPVADTASSADPHPTTFKFPVPQSQTSRRESEEVGTNDEAKPMSADSAPSVEEKLPARQTPHPRRANASIDSIINHDEPVGNKPRRPSTAESSSGQLHSYPWEPPSFGQTPTQHSPSSALFPNQQSPQFRHDRQRPPELRQAPSPRTHATMSHTSMHSPTAPVILPPPPGMNVPPPPFPPNSPYSPVHPPANDAVPHSAYSSHTTPYGHSAYSPHDPYAHSQRYPDPYSHPPTDARRLSSGSQGVPRPTYQNYSAHSSPYAGSPQQYTQRGGVMLPPFQVAPRQPPPPIRPKHGSERPQPQESGFATTPVRTSSGGLRGTSLSAPHAAHLHGPEVTVSPGSSTRWRMTANAPQSERPPPRSRSISPISDREGTPVPTKTTAPGKGRKSNATKAAEQKSGQTLNPENIARSQSVSSHVSETATPVRRGKPGPKSKKVAPSTPVTSSANGSFEEPLATAKPVKRTQSVKRKRADASVDEDESPAAPPPQAIEPPPADTVVAYRNFAKMAATVLETIASDKHAATFADAVRENQAEGYYDIVKRPQSLKSIRLAITTGTKAVTAAIDAQQSSPNGAQGNSRSGTITLPVNDKLVPPNGIVNPEQLEQEVMRMFANAVMYNQGEDEIVKDTRDMFKNVEQALQQWRAVDRGNQADEPSTPSQEEVESTAGSSKRRRA